MLPPPWCLRVASQPWEQHAWVFWLCWACWSSLAGPLRPAPQVALSGHNQGMSVWVRLLCRSRSATVLIVSTTRLNAHVARPAPDAPLLARKLELSAGTYLPSTETNHWSRTAPPWWVPSIAWQVRCGWGRCGIAWQVRCGWGRCALCMASWGPQPLCSVPLCRSARCRNVILVNTRSEQLGNRAPTLVMLCRLGRTLCGTTATARRRQHHDGKPRHRHRQPQGSLCAIVCAPDLA